MVWTLWYLYIFCEAAKRSPPDLPATTRGSAGEEEI